MKYNITFHATGEQTFSCAPTEDISIAHLREAWNLCLKKKILYTFRANNGINLINLDNVAFIEIREIRE